MHAVGNDDTEWCILCVVTLIYVCYVSVNDIDLSVHKGTHTSVLFSLSFDEKERLTLQNTGEPA